MFAINSKYNFDKDGKAMFVYMPHFLLAFIILQILPGNQLCWGYAFAVMILDLWISIKCWAKAMREEDAKKAAFRSKVIK